MERGQGVRREVVRIGANRSVVLGRRWGHRGCRVPGRARRLGSLVGRRVVRPCAGTLAGKDNDDDETACGD